MKLNWNWFMLCAWNLYWFNYIFSPLQCRLRVRSSRLFRWRLRRCSNWSSRLIRIQSHRMIWHGELTKFFYVSGLINFHCSTETMAGRKRKSSKSLFHSRHGDSSSRWSSTHSRESITRTLRLKLSSKCRQSRPTNSLPLPLSQRSTARKSPLMRCWRIRRHSCDTPPSVGTIFITLSDLNLPQRWFHASLHVIHLDPLKKFD